MSTRVPARNRVDLSVVVVVGDPDLDRADLRSAALATVGASGRHRVELIVVTMPSLGAHGAATWRRARTDVRWIAADANDQASAWSVGVGAARGEFVMWLGDGLVLRPGALDELAAAATASGSVDIVYCDHEIIRPDGEVVTAFKPRFSPERLRSQDYLSPLLVIRTSLARDIGDLAAGDRSAQLHELALRATERSREIVHIPRALVSTVGSADDDDDDHVTSSDRCRVVAEHCARVGIDAEVVPLDLDGLVRVRRRLTARPTVSVVIPTRGSSGVVSGTQRCFVVEAVRSLLERSTYRELEFVVVHDTDTPEPVLDELRSVVGDELVIVPFDGPFNFSAKINVGAARASGDLLLLLNDDTELVGPDSIEVMVGHLQTADVAMVGAKLLFEDGTLQHGGHVYHGKIHHACFGWPGTSPGPQPLHPLAIERECSGVTAAAALVKRSAFAAVDGFDESLPLNYNDVDFSLKLRAADFRIIWTPWAIWYHFESRTRRSVLRADEIESIEQRWGDELRSDPYYHPALSPDTGDWAEPRRPAGGVTHTSPAHGPLSRRLRHRVVTALLGPPPARPRGVNLVGYLDATSGLGERVRQMRAVLDAGGVRTSLWNLDLTESTRDLGEQAHRSDDGVVFDTTLAVVTALAFPGIAGVHPLLIDDVDRVIGYWFWELEEIPDTHRAAVDVVDEIWAPTRFVRDAYASAVDVPVELVPLPIARPARSGSGREHFGFRDDEFVFLTSFDHLSSMQRKNPLGVIEAFRRAFPNGDEAVRLVVKCINGDRRPDGMVRLAASSAGDARIEIRDGYLDGSEQAALIAAADGFVSLHRSEGLGLHLAEAMWLGTPVISTRYSGSLDLTLPDGAGDVAELIDAELVEVRDGGEAYRHGVWAEPDLDQAAVAMRRLVDDGQRRSDLVGRARVRMAAQADLEAAAAHVVSVLGRRERLISRRERVSRLVRDVHRRIAGVTKG